MNTKLFKQDSIIKIDDTLTVVVSLDEIKDGWFLTNDKKSIFRRMDFEPMKGDFKIILTIGTKRLDGVPVIQPKDEVEELAYKALDSESTEGSTTKGESTMFLQGYLQGYRASQSKGVYTEEQVRNLLLMIKTDFEVFPTTYVRKADNKNMTIDEMMKSLKQPKEIVEIELEQEQICCQTGISCGFPCNGEENCKWTLKIHNKENNSIIPVSVKYKS